MTKFRTGAPWPDASAADAPAEFYVLSQRAQSATPAIGCLTEFEDVICSSLGARLIAPRLRDGDGLGTRLLDRFSPIRADIPPARTGKPQVLIVTGLGPKVLDTIRALPEWRARFDIVCAYIMDAIWPLPPRHAQILAKLDHVMIPMSGNLDNYRALGGPQVHMVPLACDVAKFGAPEPDRFIDVIGYGRQYREHADLVEQAYNAPESPRMYYHTAYFDRITVSDHDAQRAMFWKVLKRSRIALAYDMLVQQNHKFDFSLVGQRWFECLTAGCAVVGRRPTCPEAETLLDWQDATIEAPEDPDLLIPFLEDLLNSPVRLAEIHARNVRQTTARHDWRHRIDDMLGHLGLDRPARLVQDIDALGRAAASM